MNRTKILIVLSVLIMLACLEPAAAAVGFEAVATVTRTKAAAASMTPSPWPSPDGGGAAPSKICARVIAETAENLRLEPGVTSRIQGHLRNGDLVRVINQLDPDWWMVSTGARIGYARSKYLEIAECEKGGE